mgnify:CR=1 FL=1
MPCSDLKAGGTRLAFHVISLPVLREPVSPARARFGMFCLLLRLQIEQDYSPVQPQSTGTSAEQSPTVLKAEDERAISNHFMDWLYNTRETSIKELCEEGQCSDDNENTMVPMYIGALNIHVQDHATVSFVKHFGSIAHRRAIDQRKAKADSAQTKASKKKQWDQNLENSEYGVAFLLFTSRFDNTNALIDGTKKIGLRLKGELEEPEKSSGVSMALRCFVYLPNDVLNMDITDNNPSFVAFQASSASKAIQRVFEKYGGIARVAILGYNMLEAGLTVQTVLEEKNGPKRVYCPQYVALATAQNAALDAQLQIAGRAFCELKSTVVEAAPSKWKIKLLGTKGMLDRLTQYSQMERMLADVKERPMFSALREEFDSKFIASCLESTIGVVGVRRGDFGAILGLTAKAAKERNSVNDKQREAYKKRKAKPNESPSPSSLPPSSPRSVETTTTPVDIRESTFG